MKSIPLVYRSVKISHGMLVKFKGNLLARSRSQEHFLEALEFFNWPDDWWILLSDVKFGLSTLVGSATGRVSPAPCAQLTRELGLLDLRPFHPQRSVLASE